MVKTDYTQIKVEVSGQIGVIKVSNAPPYLWGQRHLRLQFTGFC
jgi:hypothetical protein